MHTGAAVDSTMSTPAQPLPPQSSVGVSPANPPRALAVAGQSNPPTPLGSPIRSTQTTLSPQQASNQAGTASMAPVPSVAAASAPGAGASAGQSSASASGSKPSKSVRKVGKYQLGKTLGQGTFGKVKFATDTETGRHVAIKLMDKAKIRANNMGEQIKKEISIMKLVRCAHVVQLIEVLASASTIFVVMELVTGGELFDKIITQGCFSEDEARHYFTQLIGGISECHDRGVCHRDLKPENLLLGEDGMLKISDFGLSALTTDTADDVLHTTCGTPNYVAPEVLLSQSGYDGKAADVWSSGIILYVLLAGFLPFDETSMVELFRKIVKADFAYPATLSPEAVHLLHIILNPDPEKRATIADIRDSAWMRHITLEEWEAEKEEQKRLNKLQQQQLRQQQAEAEAAGAAAASAAASSTDATAASASSSASEAITWLDPSGVRKPASAAGAGASGLTPSQGPEDSSPGQSLRPLSLEVTRVNSNGQPASTPATPFGSLLSSPKSNALLAPSSDFSPTISPSISQPTAAGGGPTALSLGPASSGTHSAHSSPGGGSLQARRALRMPSDASDSDPLSLDDEECDVRGPIPLNAFDLINMVGGAAMGRMFQRGADKQLRTFTQFTSTLPVDDILSKLSDVLQAMSECTFKIYPRPCVVKISRSTPRGKILGSCQLYQMTPKLFMLEWRKLKGDVFLFFDFFKEVKRRFTGKNDDGSPHSGGPSDDSDAAYADGAQAQPLPRNRGNSHMIQNKSPR